MTESESVALPLGDAPLTTAIITYLFLFVNTFFKKFYLFFLHILYTTRTIRYLFFLTIYNLLTAQPLYDKMFLPTFIIRMERLNAKKRPRKFTSEVFNLSNEV